MIDNLWTVEWSFKQKAFHVESVETMLKNNREAFLRNQPTDFIPLNIFNTREEADALCDQLQLDRNAG